MPSSCTSGLWWVALVLAVITTRVTAQGLEVCYNGLGCFSNAAPFLSAQRPLSLLPQSPANVGTTFGLFTRENPTTRERETLLAERDDLLENSTFNEGRKTKFIIHGFQSNGHALWVYDLTDELLIEGDYNVIVVDWKDGASRSYTQAAANTRVVAAETERLIRYLNNRTRADWTQMHIIGHSLGAHTAGYVGHSLGSLGRITGLDPAEPLFEHTDPLVRIDPTDAAFVDIIHTDGSSILTVGFGLDQPVGDVDFYPEGGARQPGCGTETIPSKIFSDGFQSAERALSCSHSRAIELFTKDTTGRHLLSCMCWDDYEAGDCNDCAGRCSVMGFHADKHGGRGSLYLNTNDKDPFCLTDVALQNRSRFCVQSLTRQNQTVIEGCVSAMETVFVKYSSNMKDNVAEEIFCSEYENFLECVTAVLGTVQPCKDTSVRTVIGSAYTNYSLTANYECDVRDRGHRGGQPTSLRQTWLSLWVNMTAVALCLFLVMRQGH
ncbi:pancreatic triacylglycerol lipase-like [Branchiostoma lanceolatum]|uniref:pancreatic triacylglycerol lipase-like n=1 Tax=Branchiostoma lanceolatum TaxID=7740 RepID=UPI003451DACA